MSRNAKSMIKNRDRASRTLNALPDGVVIELVRRAGKREMPTRSGGERVSIAKGTFSDPTLAAVIGAEGNKELHDSVYEAVQELAQCLYEMAELSMRADQKVRYVLETADRMKEAFVAKCEACERVVECTPKDPLKSGYCGADYRAWLRAGRPDRHQFEMSVRARRDDLQPVQVLD